jgi:dihydrodipicolinate synthase/N-acetylneuraminate lyase
MTMSTTSQAGGSPPRQLRGIFPIVYTPFDADGEVVWEDLRRLCDYLLAAGAHGLAAVGGASESAKFTVPERCLLAERTLEYTAGRRPVLVGTSASNTRESVELTRHAERSGAAGVFLMPPSWAGVSADTVVRHFAHVAEAVHLPVFIQHAQIPVPVGPLAELSRRVENLCFVKEESARASRLVSEWQERSEGRLRVFTGGAHLVEDLNRGAAGAIPGSAGVADLAAAFAAHQNGDLDEAYRRFEHFLPLSHWRGPNAILRSKEVLRRLGVISGAFLRDAPSDTLDGKDHEELDRLMARMGPPF